MVKRAYIQGVGFHVPQRRMANEEFTTFLDTSDEWIVSHTGIRQRYIADAHEQSSELACVAAKRALRDAGVRAADIDCIIVVTTTPDYDHFPATACIVQHKLGIKQPVAAFDISVACSGFVYVLSVAESLIITGKYNHILLIGSEVFSKILDWKDRNTCVLFGDGAGAAVLAASDTESGIRDSILCAEGENNASLVCAPKNIEDNDARPVIKMRGKEVYLFAVKTLQDTINAILERNNLTFDDIRWVIPHQANVRIIDTACKRGGFDRDRFYVNIENYANTSAASIPIALAEIHEKGLLRRGNTIITAGFGAGLSYGANLICW